MTPRGQAASTSKRILDTKSESKNRKLDLLGPLAQPPITKNLQGSSYGTIHCPECASQRIWKDGVRCTKNGEIQRWLCRNCGYRFSQSTVELNILRQLGETPDTMNKLTETRVRSRNLTPENAFSKFSLSQRENILPHSESTIIPTVGKALYNFSSNNGNCQVCVTELKEAKNLVEVESRLEKAAGATTPTEIKGRIVEYAWWMKRQGYAETSIEAYSRNIKILAKRGANIWDSESVKDVIAIQKWSEARRNTAIASYTLFLKMHNQTWKPPICHVTRKLPFIPTEQEIDALVAGCGKKTATFLQLLKETAMRCGEANKLKWINVDTVTKTVTLNEPEKNSLPRIFKVSTKLIGMLNALPKTSKRVFGDRAVKSGRTSFYKSRKLVSQKLQNHRIMQIHFHTLRHWKATMLYHQTKDVLYVKNFLGHKKIENTLLYIQLAEVIFKETTDEFTVRVAKTPEEVKELLEVGFEYVVEKDDLMFFRKRK